jgi:hypothetical protein
MKLSKQRGINLVWVAVLSAAVGLLAAGTLVSMRQDRNIFKEILHMASGGKLGAPAPAGATGPRPIGEAAAAIVPATPGNTLRRCTINGKTVFSDVECAASTSTTVKSIDTKGVEAPKAPPKPASTPNSDPALDKVLERQLQ